MHARCEVQKCESYVDPERYPERYPLCGLEGKEPTQPSSRPSPQMVGFTSVASQQTGTSKPTAISHAHARFCKRPLKTHISGIAANSTSKPATISHAHARFCKRPPKKHISGIAANTKSKPAIPHAHARFCKQPLKKHISGIAANTKSKPAIPHVDARFCKQALKKPPQTSVASQQRANQNQPL